jgi:hypothetical protein
MTSSSPQLRRFVRRALVDATGAASPDRAQLVSAFDSLCQRLLERLRPLFGTTAVAALFARALHVARSEFPWLEHVVPKDADSCSAEGLASVGGLDLASLADGLAAVLAHDIGLLSALVGEDLILPLVQQAWGAARLPEPTKTEGNNE